MHGVPHCDYVTQARVHITPEKPCSLEYELLNEQFTITKKHSTILVD